MSGQPWSLFLAGIFVGGACVYTLLQIQSKIVNEKKDSQRSRSAKDELPVVTRDDADRTTNRNNNTNTNNNNNKTRSFTNSSSSRPTLEDVMKQNNNKLEIQAIGEIRSVYRLCVGTPRQGLLAPHARGRLDLRTDTITADAVQGLELYSHVWILFIFHLNTLPKHGKPPMKIAPPALGGRKIGVLASRSPHRPNPVGVTLARLDRIVTSNKSTSLFLSGLDLVDGTPVVDIKPFVPTYDSADQCRVPDWVSGGLALRRNVTFSPYSDEQLTGILQHEKNALEFYGKDGETLENTISNVRACIEEVLSIDVRSQWQTSKARKGEFKAQYAERLKQQDVSITTDQDDGCTQQLDNLLIRYHVKQANKEGMDRQSSQGSGAEDVVIITSIELFG